MHRPGTILLGLAAVGALTTYVAPAPARAQTSGPLLECHSSARAPYLCDAVGGCDRDLKLARIRMDGAFRCYSRWLDCDLFTRTQSSAAGECPQRAAAHCVQEQATEDVWVTGSAPEQRERVLERCTPIDFEGDFLAGAPLGLGIGADTATCDALGVPLQDVASYTACGDVGQTRLHAEILSLMAPRSRELLEDHGWCSLFPEEGVAPIVCNTALAARPTVQGVPSARVSRLRRCQKRLYESFRQVLNRHLNLLENCTEEYFSCNLRTAHGDITPSATANCIARGLSVCERQQSRRDSKIPRAIENIRKACEDLTFEDLTDILGYEDIAATCNAATIDDIVTCAADRLRCLAWDVARFVEPRITDDTPPEFLADYLPCEN